MTLLLVWSTVAIMVLMALGFWVARRVSDPIVELDEGARRIADGDFSTKVDVHGRNEIARLSETFNEMTDSLRQRSEVLTKKVLELATLYEMSRSLGSTLEMDELLGSVLESALRIFDLDVGYIALRDKETGTLQVRAVLGGELDLVGGGDAVRSSMAGWVVREARPLIFNPDPATDKSRIDSLTRAKAALCVPLVSSEGTIGAMTVGSNDQEYRFTSDDVRLLSTIGKPCHDRDRQHRAVLAAARRLLRHRALVGGGRRRERHLHPRPLRPCRNVCGARRRAAQPLARAANSARDGGVPARHRQDRRA